MKRMTVPPLAVALLAAAGASSGEDLAAVYEQARGSDPVLAAAQAALEASQELRPQARSFLLPNIQLDANTAKNTLRTDSTGFFASGKTEFNSNAVTVQAVQPLFNWQLIAGLGQADAIVRQAQNQYAFSEQELMLRTAQRYFEVLAALDNLEFSRAEKEAIGRQLEQARQRFEVGLIAITDIHEAQARYDLTRAQEIQARNRLLSALEALGEVTGTQPAAMAILRPEVALLAPQPAEPESWVETALATNPLIAAASEARLAAEKEIQRQRAGHFPTVAATATYINSSDNGGRFGGALDAEDTIFGLQMNVPIFQGGLVRSRVREAQARLREATERLDGQRRATTRQTRDAYLGVNAAVSRIDALRAAVVSNSSALEATQLGYRVGTRTSVDVLDAQRALYGARRDLSAARYDYVVNLLALRQAAGTLAAKDLAEVNGWLSAEMRSVDPDAVTPRAVELPATGTAPAQELPPARDPPIELP
jgi:outer membrane protein